ncbi:hypothetical protein GCM10009557_62550 [Virgisporangium ochraceum]|uniref:Uncharacterized protein n=1 Tax=Virgisporangium ochraceum TaxID=65505 RepID=A0A8J3ZQ88_9ACTN|nr:hypothetical protein [Virgisporangium ochraceum]GIJ65571.1 hypothetical protein Voc01_004880 [Virgisporangium ochraceum]
MAISRYLVSNRNLVGCALALVGLGLHLVGVAGRFWPLVMVGLYLLGVVVTPGQRVRLVGTGPQDLRAAFDRLVRRARKEKVPTLVLVRLRRIEVLVDGLLARPAELAAHPDAWLAVDSAVRTDLPASFEAYLNLPRWYAGRRQLPGTGRSAEQELVEQLRSVERVLKATADTVHGDRARWLVEHGRRLDEQAEQAGP